MNKINVGRVLLGGLAAGVVMNISEAALHGGVLGQDAAALFKSLNIPDSPNPVYLISLIVITFVLGIGAVWLYAAIRTQRVNRVESRRAVRRSEAEETVS
ncbi:MAG: hypothetical protein L0Y75_05855 [Acidobacteria bacterium]|nr:hypothetical protein [Acidobacteriota bacterium]